MKIDRGGLNIFIKNCYFARLSFTDNSAGEQLETKTPAFYYLAIAFFCRVFSYKTLTVYRYIIYIFFFFKDNVRIKEHGMFTSAIKNQTYVFVILFQTWIGIMGKKRKRKAILLLAYIADVSCLTNRFFYMRKLTLSFSNHQPTTYKKNRLLTSQQEGKNILFLR